MLVCCILHIATCDIAYCTLLHATLLLIFLIFGAYNIISRQGALETRFMNMYRKDPEKNNVSDSTVWHGLGQGAVNHVLHCVLVLATNTQCKKS